MMDTVEMRKRLGLKSVAGEWLDSIEMFLAHRERLGDEDTLDIIMSRRRSGRTTSTVLEALEMATRGRDVVIHTASGFCALYVARMFNDFAARLGIKPRAMDKGQRVHVRAEPGRVSRLRDGLTDHSVIDDGRTGR